ncbi:MAG: hypothetical protein D8M57_06665 [Candidatus Scalindua sp. AMX11]|nr:MAG: hypothetical protein DWQ00_13730 [Candidatus Scalindua sp.]TDE65764.1 MAG: hypothetical protein D8M57_06665 [Candidatus Scalindua sp. AMX11]
MKIMEGNIIYHCTTCGKPLKRKDNRKIAVAFILNGVLLFPILVFVTDGAFVPLVNLVINITIAIVFISKKEGHVYFCRSCQTKYFEDELKDLG